MHQAPSVVRLDPGLFGERKEVFTPIHSTRMPGVSALRQAPRCGPALGELFSLMKIHKWLLAQRNSSNSCHWIMRLPNVRYEPYRTCVRGWLLGIAGQTPFGKPFSTPAGGASEGSVPARGGASDWVGLAGDGHGKESQRSASR